MSADKKNMKTQEKRSDEKDYVVGPNGEKRSKDAESNAIHVMKVATGMTKEESVESEEKPKSA